MGDSAARRQPQPEPEICICAAIKLTDGRIIRGHRHDDCIQTAIKWKVVDRVTQERQGFITSRNRYVDRVEGADLQGAAGIVSAMTGKPVSGLLFSEDLYFEPTEYLPFAARRQPDEPCEHEWVTGMIQMPQGYSKPGGTICRKCGAFRVPTHENVAVAPPGADLRAALREKVTLFQQYRDAPMSDAGKTERNTIRRTLNVVVSELAALLDAPCQQKR